MLSKKNLLNIASLFVGLTFIHDDVSAFSPMNHMSKRTMVSPATTTVTSHANKQTAIFSSEADEFVQETPEQTQKRISGLVEENPVLLFMKGTKIFPQCGFSSTAVQILNTFNIVSRDLQPSTVKQHFIEIVYSSFHQWHFPD